MAPIAVGAGALGIGSAFPDGGPKVVVGLAEQTADLVAECRLTLLEEII